MTDHDRRKYEAVRKILTAPSETDTAEISLRGALEDAIAAMKLAAGSLTLLDDGGQAVVDIRSGDSDLAGALKLLEERMLDSLRSKFGIETLYSTLNLDGPKSIFSYAIKSGDRVIGTVSGICDGARNIALEQEFIEVMAAALRSSRGQAGQIKSARVEAMRETTATLNHEINNPLTVVLGNVQLLLMKADSLPEDVVKRLKLIEQSGLRIRDAVGQLMRLNEARTTTYIDNQKMIDLQGSETSEE